MNKFRNRANKVAGQCKWCGFLAGDSVKCPKCGSVLRKYRNEKTDGYPSKHQAKIAAELKQWQKLGIISELEEEVTYELVPKQDGERAVKYRADFRYRDSAGELVVADAKGKKTPDYIIKRKLMLQVHKIRVQEV